MSRQQAAPAEERAERALAELRETLREAHGLLKDLRAAVTTAQRVLETQRRLIDGDIEQMVTQKLSDEVTRGLNIWDKALQSAIAESEKRTIDRFDALAASLLGEEAGERSFEEIVRVFMDRQRFLEAQFTQAVHDGRIQIPPEPRFPPGGMVPKPPPIAGLEEYTGRKKGTK